MFIIFQFIILLNALPTLALSIGNTAESIKFYGGICDASSSIPIRFGNDPLFTVIDDEQNILVTVQASSTKAVKTFNFDSLIDGQSIEADGEGGSIINGNHFYLTSHGRNKRGQLDDFTRYWFFSQNFTNTYKFLAHDMLDDPDLLSIQTLLKSSTQFNKKTVEDLAPKVNGLCFEGLAEGNARGEAFIGLRNPLNKGKAILVPFTNPEQVLSGEKGVKADYGAPVLFDFGGRAFRDIKKVVGTLPTGEPLPKYLMTAGAVDSTPPGFKLYSWTGKSEDGAVYVGDLPEKTESVFWDDVTKYLWAVTDEGSTVVGGIACKDLDSTKKFFTGNKIKME